MKDISRDILLQASLGDEEAFEMIYRAASEFVYTIAFRITNNRDDAEDVTQEVFIKIYKNLKDFRFLSSFKTWVYRITVNAAITACKGITEEMNRRDDDSSLAEQCISPLAETAIDQDDTERLITDLLGVLNPDQRACIVLREIEGLNYKEISEVLNININTVRSRLKRAREALIAYRKSEATKNEMQKNSGVALDRLS
ncbi:MAG: RNA polymerase sigma factor [bacterium]